MTTETEAETIAIDHDDDQADGTGPELWICRDCNRFHFSLTCECGATYDRSRLEQQEDARMAEESKDYHPRPARKPIHPVAWLPEPDGSGHYSYPDGSTIVRWPILIPPHDTYKAHIWYGSYLVDADGETALFDTPAEAAEALAKLGHGPAAEPSTRILDPGDCVSPEVAADRRLAEDFVVPAIEPLEVCRHKAQVSSLRKELWEIRQILGADDAHDESTAGAARRVIAERDKFIARTVPFRVGAPIDGARTLGRSRRIVTLSRHDSDGGFAVHCGYWMDSSLLCEAGRVEVPGKDILRWCYETDLGLASMIPAPKEAAKRVPGPIPEDEQPGAVTPEEWYEEFCEEEVTLEAE